MLDTSNRSIHNWSHEPRWAEVLDTLDYEGERHFRVQPRRDTHENPNFEAVESAYLEALEQGVPKKNIVAHVAKITGTKVWTVRYWAGKYGWDT